MVPRGNRAIMTPNKAARVEPPSTRSDRETVTPHFPQNLSTKDISGNYGQEIDLPYMYTSENELVIK